MLGQKTGLTGPTFVLKAPTLFSSFAFSSLSADSFSFASLPESGRRPDHTGTISGSTSQEPESAAGLLLLGLSPCPALTSLLAACIAHFLNMGKLRYVAEDLPQALERA